MVDRLSGITAKIERAKEHIDDFTAEWIAFGRRAYEIVPDENLDEVGRRTTFRLRVHEAMPLRFGTIVGDAISNMRTALDYVVYQLLDAKGVSIRRHHYFPISSSADQFESSYQGKVEGIGDDAERLIKGLKPYKGGTDGFWVLDELRRTDMHHLLLTVVIRPEGLALNLADLVGDMPGLPGTASDQDALLTELRGQHLLIRAKSRPCPVLEDGAIIHSRSGEMNAHKNTQFGFAIAFGEGEVLECEPVGPALRQMLDLVKGTVEPFRPLLS